MTVNMGTMDRVIRGVLGGAAIVVVALGLPAAPWNWVLVGLAVVLLATAALGFCPVYALFGARTNGPGRAAGSKA